MVDHFNCKQCGQTKGKCLSTLNDNVKRIIVVRYKCNYCKKITKITYQMSQNFY